MSPPVWKLRAGTLFAGAPTPGMARLHLRGRPVLRGRLHRHVNGLLESLPAIGAQFDLGFF